jgi:hypothetical protein
MFFKKKAALGDQFAVFRERETPRYASGGGITIEGFEGEGRIKNVCVSGCCMDSVTYAALTPGKAYQVKILPGAGVSQDPFSLRLMVTWIKSSEMVFEAGFSLEPGEKYPALERYVELLKNKGIQPEYGNMGQGPG